MIADFFFYLIDNERDDPTPMDVLSRYLIEPETEEVQKIYESMKARIEQSQQTYYCDGDREKEKAVQRQIIGESHFKESEKEVPMLGLLGTLIKRNFRVPEE